MFRTIALAVVATVFATAPVSAATIDLFDYGFNIDGTVSFPTLGDSVPVAADISGFDTLTGLGTISVAVATEGSHYVGLYVDHEIDETVNTFFNENGASVGAPGAGQSWEVDEPGFVFGDIFGNFNAGVLDNSNGVPAGSEDDVSMAMGFDFVVGPNQSAMVTFLLSLTAPSSGFYLVQNDPDSNASVYFSSTLTIEDTEPVPTPEPSETFTTVSMIAALFLWARRRRAFV